MRLRDYQNLLNRAIPVIEQVKITEKSSSYTTVYNITNIQAFLEILKEFKHYEDDEYASDIQIELVSGSVRVTLE